MGRMIFISYSGRDAGAGQLRPGEWKDELPSFVFVDCQKMGGRRISSAAKSCIRIIKFARFIDEAR